MAASDPFVAFSGQKYLSLETYRRDGRAVRTPLWFAAAPEESALYVYTLASSGKVKRLRRSSDAKIAPSDMRGHVSGPWIEVQATFVQGDTYTRAMRLLDRKYWPLKPIMNVLSRLRSERDRERVVIALRPA